MSASRLLVCLVAALLSANGVAQTYPSKTVTILLGFPAGSPPEIQARFLAQHLEKAWKQPVVLDIRPGAGGLIATQTLVKAPPDGHTLHWTTATIAALKVLIKDPGFDNLRDIAPVSTVIDSPGGIVTNTQIPARNVDEFIAYVKANPGKLNYGSAGRNTVMLVLEAFKRAAGIQLTEISYAGQPQYMTALLRNDVQLVQAQLNLQMKAQVDANQVRPLLIVGNRRSKVFPDLPTAAERGWNIPRNGWNSIVAPANTPKPILEAIAAEIARYVATPEAIKQAADNGLDMVATTPEQLRQLIESDSRTWAEIAAAIGLQPQ
jgi:tripartite-type tricarboxylate transporter receptor subunit TctC